ncbi:MAG TPA: M23 family metallopeptidase [Nocardioides sp.]|uniref:M23 family metallopeptidase n=1 Tax=Nocardioides sp. TaxID=35761 RepID=UPI002F42558A
MGDHRAGPSGSTATTVTPAAHVTGKRVARHAAERLTSQPYVGRRVAGRTPAAPHVAPPPVVPPAVQAEPVRIVGRRIALDPQLAPEPDDVVGHLLRPSSAPATVPTIVPTIAPTVGSYAGRRARTLPLIVEPEPEPVVEVVELVELEPVVEVVEPEPEPVVEIKTPEPELVAQKIKPSRQPGRRVASRRARIPSLPLLAGVAVLAISAGGALQAVHPGLQGAEDAGRLAPAGALSGSSAVGSASLLGGRGTIVSRSADRQALSGGSLQAVADAQAKQRDAALSAFAAQAQKQAAQIKLHQWVLPVAPGVYHLTARFGDYSSLWAHFHTGLDFAAPTGTPIMAVAGGTVTEVGYSGAYGNRTIETLPDGTELWYCHQNAFGTSVGATVKPGQVIGYVGSTGNVTGPHLHLEVHPGGGDPVDPYTALVVHGLNP